MGNTGYRLFTMQVDAPLPALLHEHSEHISRLPRFREYLAILVSLRTESARGKERDEGVVRE